MRWMCSEFIDEPAQRFTWLDSFRVHGLICTWGRADKFRLVFHRHSDACHEGLKILPIPLCHILPQILEVEGSEGHDLMLSLQGPIPGEPRIWRSAGCEIRRRSDEFIGSIGGSVREFRGRS